MTNYASLQSDLGFVPNGPYVAGEVMAGEAQIEVMNPATERPISTIGAGGVETALIALDAAESALVDWGARSPRDRSETLRRAFELMTARAGALAQLIVQENGKSLRDALGEVAYAAEFFRWYAEEAVRLSGTIETSPSGINKIVVLRQPIGVAVLITPWNFPAAMATRKIAPALAAGCTVVLKPASETPLTSLAIAAILSEAGVPAGVVNVVPSRQADAVSARLLDDPRVRKLSFTGSTEVGRALLAHASRSIVSTSMELGGNAAFVVLEDADLDAAVKGALVAKLRNGGSACTAANRFIVHDSVAQEFAHRMADSMRDLVVGPGLDRRTDIGPLVNESTRSKVASLVEGAKGEGARALVGGSAPAREGYYYLPTVLDHVPASAAILSEEIFGPVAPIVRFDDLDEAIDLANSTEFGLASYVYTSDLARGLRVAERIDAGMIGLNRAIVSDPAAPFGGTQQSGLGREGGHEGMLEFTESKYIAVDW